MSIFRDIGDAIFGTTPKAKTTSPSVLTPEQRKLLDTMVKQFQGKTGDIAGFEQYPGEVGAQANNLQGMSLAALEQMSMNMAQPDSNQALAEDQLGSFLRGEKTGESSFNDFFKSNVQDPAVEAFNEDVLPSISRDYGGSSFFGSDRKQADQQATEDLSTGLTRERAAGQYAERNKNLDVMLAAIGLAPQVTGAYAGINAGMLDSSLKAREAEQNTLDAMFKKHLAEQAMRGDSFEQMLKVLQTPAFENVVLNKPGSTGMLQSFLDSFASGMGSTVGKCFIAREVFGYDNPEWIRFFVWKEQMAPTWFSNWYDRNALKVSNYIQNKPRIKTIIRIWMRWVIKDSTFKI